MQPIFYIYFNKTLYLNYRHCVWPCWYTGSGLLSLDLNFLLHTVPVQGSRVSFSTILEREQCPVEISVKVQARQERKLPCARLKHHANQPPKLSLLLANVRCLDNNLDKLWNCCALIFKSLLSVSVPFNSLGKPHCCCRKDLKWQSTAVQIVWRCTDWA